MAQTSPVVVTGGNVEGNIGSCEIKSTPVSADSWHTQVVAVNSCTGQVIYQSPIYFDWTYIYLPIATVLVLIAFGAMMRIMFD